MEAIISLILCFLSLSLKESLGGFEEDGGELGPVFEADNLLIGVVCILKLVFIGLDYNTVVVSLENKLI